MLKKSILSVCLFLMGNVAFAQGVLQVTDISQPNDVYSSADDEAAVIIRCHESIPPEIRFNNGQECRTVPV